MLITLKLGDIFEGYAEWKFAIKGKGHFETFKRQYTNTIININNINYSLLKESDDEWTALDELLDDKKHQDKHDLEDYNTWEDNNEEDDIEYKDEADYYERVHTDNQSHPMN